MGTRTMTWALPLLVVPMLVPVLFLVLTAGVGAQGPVQLVACGTTLPGAETVAGTHLDAEQMHVARQIVAAVRAFPPTADKPHAAVVALATARQESGIRNLEYGDRDSLGAFQQRSSQGWGTPTQVRNVGHATRSFLTRLVRVPSWETMRVTDAAATVQRPAAEYRGLYEQWVSLATGLTQRLWGTAATLPSANHPASTALGAADPCGSDSVPSHCTATGGAAEAGLTPDALRVMRCALTLFGPHVVGGVGQRPANPDSDHPAGRAVDIMIGEWGTPVGKAEGWRIARWAKDNAVQLGVTYVIFDAQIWSTGRTGEGWRTYAHPSGATDATSLHLDHVHVSVVGNAGTTATSGFRTTMPGDS